MDKKINYIIGLDTETCNAIEEDGVLDLSQSIVYDIGWQITDRKGNAYIRRSFVVYEVFCGMKKQMASAYYAEKIPQYETEIGEGIRKIARLKTILRIFHNDCKSFRVKNVFAHNASFDLRALNNTIRYITKSDIRYWFPRNIEIWDTLKMARQTFGKEKTYVRWCETNGYMTKHSVPRPRLTAEILYRYISGDNSFEESHTGLEDVIIETEIFVAIMRKHRKVEKRLYVD